MIFGKRKQRREAAHKAWMLGGATAAKSLEDDLRRHAEEQEEVLLFDTSEAGANMVLRFVSGMPDPVGNAAIEVGEALKADNQRADVAKRLTYRQAVFAASYLTGQDRSVQTCLEIESELLGLSDSE